MKKTLLALVALLSTTAPLFSNIPSDPQQTKNDFLGMWGFDIEGGGIGWLNVHEDKGFLDGELLWIGGSIVPVSHIYLANENTLVVTRTYERKAKKDEERTHTITQTLRISKTGDDITGTMTGPNRSGTNETVQTIKGKRMLPVGSAPDLAKLKYGKPIKLFNGKDLKGWRPIDPKKPNGFKIVNGTLQNDPAQPENGEHISYGNLRTEEEFGDFNLQLEVNVPKDNNSGIYLRGLYEIQVVDSYGKELDSHNMGAVYSRVTPSEAAEKPAGEWQTMDITLVERHITVILNGKKIVDNQPIPGPTGGAISYDVSAKGPLYLQGDHGNVAYRNIVLKPIL